MKIEVDWNIFMKNEIVVNKSSAIAEIATQFCRSLKSGNRHLENDGPDSGSTY